MGKTRELFKQIRDIKGTFHAKMGTIKDRNYMDLTEKRKGERRGKGERERQRRKAKIYPFECRVPKNSERLRKSSSVINAKK